MKILHMNNKNPRKSHWDRNNENVSLKTMNMLYKTVKVLDKDDENISLQTMKMLDKTVKV